MSRHDDYDDQNIPGDAWQMVATGYIVSWELDWHRAPFQEVICATLWLAREVVQEIHAWLLVSLWRDTQGRRTTRTEVAAVADGYEIRAWRETREVLDRPRRIDVEIDGQTYSRVERELIFGEWEPMPTCKLHWRDDPWRKWGPADDGHTEHILVTVRPHVVQVLTACGQEGARLPMPDAHLEAP